MTVCRIEICAFRDQIVEMFRCCGRTAADVEKWCGFHVIFLIDPGSFFQQSAENIDISKTGCIVKRSVSWTVNDVDVGSFRKQFQYGFQIILPGGLENRGKWLKKWDNFFTVCFVISWEASDLFSGFIQKQSRWIPAGILEKLFAKGMQEVLNI